MLMVNALFKGFGEAIFNTMAALSMVSARSKFNSAAPKFSSPPPLTGTISMTVPTVLKSTAGLSFQLAV